MRYDKMTKTLTSSGGAKRDVDRGYGKLDHLAAYSRCALPNLKWFTIADQTQLYFNIRESIHD